MHDGPALGERVRRFRLARIAEGREHEVMRFPNDTGFHLRMATLLIAAMFLEHLASTRLQTWSAPQIGVVTFVLGLCWVALTGFHHAKAQADRLRVLEDRLERLQQRTEQLEDDERQRRALPPMGRPAR